jgi:hypothetical protein
MAALYSITQRLSRPTEGGIQFKSPDYQKSITHFRSIVGSAPDYEKIMIFLNVEKWPADRTEELSGFSTVAGHTRVRHGPQKDRSHIKPATKIQAPAQQEISLVLKDKLIWI